MSAWSPLVAQLGRSSLSVCLGLCVVGLCLTALSLVRRDTGLGRLSVTVALLCAFCLTLSMGALESAFFARDFSLRYVFDHSNSALPPFYTAAALWGGHEGSLLLWAWLLSVFAALSTWLNRRRHAAEIALVVGIQLGLLAFFMGLLIFFSNPFDPIFPGDGAVGLNQMAVRDMAVGLKNLANVFVSEGSNLNPLLQDPGMVIHPPMLYLGYVGFTVPFSFAMAGLLSGRMDGLWLFTVRRWALLAWLFLTTGITLGAFWAYRELGWGGWWGWDPVENASFLPWLLGTAFLHSMMVQQKRRTFQMWTLGLCILTYGGCLFGTFLVRSGVLTSVHSFAADPQRGVYLLGFLTVVMALSFLLLNLKSAALRDTATELENALSREGAILFNNMLMVVATAAVFGGTIYPLVLESINPNLKISVGPPYFNKVLGPLFAGLLVLMGAGPLLPWRRMTAGYFRRNFFWPLLVGVVGVVVAVVGLGPSPGGALAGFAIAFCLGGVGQEFVWAARQKGRLSVAVLNRRTGANRRKYGGLIIHLGILFYALAIVASVSLKTEADYHLRSGDHFFTHGYHVVFKGLKPVKGPNYTATQATLDVYRHGAPFARLIPQKREYGEGLMPTTEASIVSTLREDLYSVLAEVDEDGRGAVVRIYHNPMVMWFWIGAVVVILGALLSLAHREKPPVDPLVVKA